jgi:hypothetical protein
MKCPKCTSELVKTGTGTSIQNDPIEDYYECINSKCPYYQKHGRIIKGKFQPNQS